MLIQNALEFSLAYASATFGGSTRQARSLNYNSRLQERSCRFHHPQSQQNQKLVRPLSACLFGRMALKVSPMKFLTRRLFILSALLVLIPLRLAAAADQPVVNVILWFDTEDYLLPADDDASKRLAEMLTQRSIRATFKIVGEKARVLEQRRRRDVIAALKKHDIGYHANFHSVHPTPSEYLADAGLLDGMAEFVRREGGGAADVRRIFAVHTLSCYGQPGSSWAAQTMAALPQIGVAPDGVPCYVDEGTHIGLH